MEGLITYNDGLFSITQGHCALALLLFSPVFSPLSQPSPITNQYDDNVWLDNWYWSGREYKSGHLLMNERPGRELSKDRSRSFRNGVANPRPFLDLFYYSLVLIPSFTLIRGQFRFRNLVELCRSAIHIAIRNMGCNLNSMTFDRVYWKPLPQDRKGLIPPLGHSFLLGPLYSFKSTSSGPSLPNKGFHFRDEVDLISCKDNPSISVDQTGKGGFSF
jgi:hypothetical protein